MNGKLYGIGVGPGDPELLTLKALRLIKEADVIAVPGKIPEESIAYQIAAGAYADLTEKELLAVEMPMIRDKAALACAHEKAAEQIRKLLVQGKNVMFLTLGDPTVYSTYLYLHRRIAQAGYETEIVNGIPSFCAAAAKLNCGLVENQEPLHVIPTSDAMEDALQLSGTKVFMKAGKKIGIVKKKLLETGVSGMMIENCTMAEEKRYLSAEEIPEDAGYYSLVIVKERK